MSVKIDLDASKIAVIGLGYVGLPLAVEFGRSRPVVGFDISEPRIAELQSGTDSTLELTDEEMAAARHLVYTSAPNELRDCGIFIVTVPTPIDKFNRPDLGPLIRASAMLGGLIPDGAVVIYESTVYPGATEEVCVPEIERVSGKVYNKDFFCGYSPERINPGDSTRRLPNIVKVTSGSTPEIAMAVDALYAQIISAGTYMASSIRVAEAAKVIENTQRDLNIALVNELSMIFRRLGIDTLEILEAAGTKWNFLPFRPGLVGGHCIGIDPYYLTHKAQEVGYHPEVILAGRRINDGMGGHVADQVVKLMLRKGHAIRGAKALILGLTFKENCPDLRNTKVVDLIAGLQSYHMDVDVHDPWVDSKNAEEEYGITCFSELPEPGKYDAVVLAVSHRQYIKMGSELIRALGQENAVLYDVKSILPLGDADGRL